MPRMWPLVLALLVCFGAWMVSSGDPKILSYTVVAEYPHDPHAFTQGLQFDRACDGGTQQCYDIFWESTGLYGESSIRQTMVNTGEIKQMVPMGQSWFGEGMAKVGDSLYQLTWKTGTIFKYTLEKGKLKKVGEVKGPLSDGWGLTSDGTHLIATDSSANLYFIDPASLKVGKKGKLVRTIKVTDGGRPVPWLNELEVIDGELWANIWQTECIARVDLKTGEVTHWLLMHGLRHGLHQRHPTHHELDVLNGIAYDSVTKRMFVTGKKWPRIFEIVPKPHPSEGHPSLEQVRAQCIVRA